MTPSKKEKPLIMWQAPMVKLLYALSPIILASVYFFGWRSLLLLAAVNLAGFLSEYIFAKKYKEPVTSAVFVTGCLLSLSLPPTIPIWMGVLGAIFAVVFGKMVFGGFGRNVFNPAMVGRTFLYINFTVFMTTRWVEPFQGFAGGFARYFPSVDALTKATPMMKMQHGEGAVPYLNLFLGNISGSLGETCAFLIILGGIYLLWQKVANYRIMAGALISLIFFQTLFWKMGIPRAVDPLSAVLGGSALFGIVFIATDPVSAAQTDEGRWIYGALMGFLTTVIGVFSGWSAGTMFAVLLCNMFNPIIDYGIRQMKAKRKGEAKTA